MGGKPPSAVAPLEVPLLFLKPRVLASREAAREAALEADREALEAAREALEALEACLARASKV